MMLMDGEREREVGWVEADASTYETDKEEEHLEASANGSDAVDVTVTNGGHGDHEKIHAVPVA